MRKTQKEQAEEVVRLLANIHEGMQKSTYWVCRSCEHGSSDYEVAGSEAGNLHHR